MPNVVILVIVAAVNVALVIVVVVVIVVIVRQSYNNTDCQNLLSWCPVSKSDTFADWFNYIFVHYGPINLLNESTIIFPKEEKGREEKKCA